jgi:nifR3 family TIM-barrel protein
VHANHERLHALYANKPVILAPMEDVTDVVFRRLARGLGAEVCMTEFVNVEGLLRGCRNARRKIRLSEDDGLTAIQIYGADPTRLAEAARFAEEAEPLLLDVNCGCWVPKIAARGAGAGWLREPTAMVAMAKMVVSSVALPVTVKTRIGWGPESEMPIVDLARRLEDAGVAALTIHCRTAKQGHAGAADWTWAARAREVVSMPVIVNGDVKSADDAERALRETGCAGVMIGRRAIEHPWIFRECHARLRDGTTHPAPTDLERIALCKQHLLANVAERGELYGVRCTRRHLGGYLSGLRGAAQLRQALNRCDSLDGSLAILDRYLAGASPPSSRLWRDEPPPASLVT